MPAAGSKYGFWTGIRRTEQEEIFRLGRLRLGVFLVDWILKNKNLFPRLDQLQPLSDDEFLLGLVLLESLDADSLQFNLASQRCILFFKLTNLVLLLD